MAPFVLAGTLVCGAFYGSQNQVSRQVIQPLYDEVIVLTGRVKEDGSVGQKGSVTLQLDQIEIGGHSLEGSVWVSTTTKADTLRGDEVTINGKLGEGFGTFVGVMYRAMVTKVDRPVPGDIGRVVRDWFATAVRIGIPEPQASLGIGFLTGQKSALPESLAESLRIAGLSHIVVASGYNLTILVRLARRLFIKYSKYLSTLTSSLMIISFVAITGLSPSMTRAGLVSGLSLLAWYYGRSFHPFVLLPVAAAITVAWQPSYVWGDLGWQLSFAAFAGVMIVAPLLQKYFFGDKEPGTLRQILGETIAAHLVTIPIIVPAFGMISHVAILANIMIVPLVPLAMLLTFISGVVGLVVPGISEFVSLPIAWLLTYMTSTATFLSELPWAQTELHLEVWVIVLYIVVLAGFCWHMQRATQLSLRETNIII